jgi:hypothetical protein
VNFFTRAGLLSYDKKQTSVYAAYGWLVGALSNALYSTYEVSKIDKPLKQLVESYKNAKGMCLFLSLFFHISTY